MSSIIDSGNLPLLEELYQHYLVDPSSVDPSWYPYFEHFEEASLPGDQGINNLIEAYRTYGHLRCQCNPIQIQDQGQVPELESELGQKFPKIREDLERIYCSKIGFEIRGLGNPSLEDWLVQKIEREARELTIEEKKMILQFLNKSELFEVFLHTKYVGQKRFSLEGGETLIPILASLLDTGSFFGISDVVIGMAHRGRLNVLSNIMDKSYASIFAEFEESYIPQSFEGSGDVKYHKGFSSSTETLHGKKVHIFLSPNPSHLESVDPVVEGIVRAKMDKKNDLKRETIVPILVHGDAAVSGQGVVYETMQMGKLEGFATGGTIHLVINNQIGFTTVPKDGRSTHYCTDIAKTFGAPVFHVNAEDPESCVIAAKLAIEARQKFHCDVFIDINCYRKFGHNESDEPAFTQPIEYSIIRAKRPIREIYRDHLIQEGIVEKKIAEDLEEEFKGALQKQLIMSKEPLPQSPQGGEVKQSLNTAVSLKRLEEVTRQLSVIPEGFSIHPKLLKLVKERESMVTKERPIDWGMAETLAYGTLLEEKRTVRLTGQDCCRGTFSHRHAIWMDQVKEMAYFPLKTLGNFEIYNSHLSEFACLGFEYGYSLAFLEALVIWEAQFGDFANSAQVIIDQYLVASEQKWNQKNALVLFLPHGFEGQGPEHSSARIERFLTLCGNDNMRVVYPTTPAQMFHLLRNQAINQVRKPLVVFTPKGLLRHPECVSSLKDLTDGKFEEIILDPNPPKKPKRLVLCSGRIYYDLHAERVKRKTDDLMIVRIEQLYPLIDLNSIPHQGMDHIYWVQEEPKNMGAWGYIESNVLPVIPHIEFIGRPKSASPATGSHLIHKHQHEKIIETLFGK